LISTHHVNSDGKLKITKGDFDYVEKFKLTNKNFKDQFLKDISYFNYHNQVKTCSVVFQKENCENIFSKKNEKYELIRNIYFKNNFQMVN